GTFADLARVDRSAMSAALRRATTEQLRVTIPAPFQATVNPPGLRIAALDLFGNPDPRVVITPILGEGIEGLSGAPIDPLRRSTPPQQHELQQDWPTTRAIRSSVLRVRWHDGPTDEVHVASVPLWGSPARLDLPVKSRRTPDRKSVG